MHPENAGAWGWRKEQYRDGPEWKPQGRRVGWLDGAFVYLEPDAAFAAAQEMAQGQGESLSVSARTLWQRMRERGLLAACDREGDKARFTVRRTVEGIRRPVLCLLATALAAPDEGDEGDKNAPNEDNKNDKNAPVAHSVCANGTPKKAECATENATIYSDSDHLAHLAHQSGTHYIGDSELNTETRKPDETDRPGGTGQSDFFFTPTVFAARDPSDNSFDPDGNQWA